MLAYSCFYTAIILAAYIDFRKKIIPDSLSVLLLFSGVLTIYITGNWLNRIMGFLIVGILLLTIAIKTDGLGGGDVKFCASLVFATGIMPGSIILFISFLFAALYTLIKQKKSKEIETVPLAPFFALGTLCYRVVSVFL